MEAMNDNDESWGYLTKLMLETDACIKAANGLLNSTAKFNRDLSNAIPRILEELKDA